MKAWRRTAKDRGTNCGVVPTNLVLVATAGGDLDFTWQAPTDPEGWIWQLLHPVEPLTVIIDSGDAGDVRQVLILIPDIGDYQFRIRDSASPESCWVYSELLNIP